MDDLIAWVRGQIEADKAAAEAAQAGDGYAEWDNSTTGVVQVAAGEMDGLIVAPKDIAVHIARHDPRDMIADCDAKLAMLDLCERTLVISDEKDEHGVYFSHPIARRRIRDVIRLLAQGYQHRDGYQPEWHPA